MNKMTRGKVDLSVDNKSTLQTLKDIANNVVELASKSSALTEEQQQKVKQAHALIAEALFVTALGLFVAIPSTAFYNMITSRIDAYLSEAESFGKDLVNIISRQVN